mgnify:CR=1 FL=1
MEEMTFYVEEEYVNMRLDKYVAVAFPELSRSYVQKLIEEGKILKNQTISKGKDAVKAGDEILVTVPEPEGMTILPEKMDLAILYEDSDIIVVNKPKGMVVHPAAGHYEGTLVNGLLYHCKESLSGINGVLRPGIVHRIDRDTTGVLVVCKNDTAHRNLAEQFKVHSIIRYYDAIVYNAFKEASGHIETLIGRNPKDRLKMAVTKNYGKNAITGYRVLENFGNKYSHIRCKLETGRTHQIRVHMAHIGHPLLGDTVYGPGKDPFSLQGQALHAGVLGFIHPTSGEYMEFSAPLPEYFINLMEKLENKEGKELL